MRTRYFALLFVFLTLAIFHGAADPAEPLSISGIYPALASFNGHGECGIGAVVNWAGQLWWITYPPHMRTGSNDKLYSIDDHFRLTIHPESVGGTDANRLIHRESEQLIIGPYFISKTGQVRAADVRHALVGRMTATARHLTDPANKVYFYDMEGALLEVDVHTLEVKRLFEKPIPDWHGKGAYTAQGRLVLAENGNEKPGGELGKPEFVDREPPSPENSGALAEWDGSAWRVLARRQFTDVTGPGGISGSPNDRAPLWALGWDKRSVVLKLLDAGQWQTFRFPKGTYAFDAGHGWYSEWPRIREAAPGHWLMDTHGQFWDFPSEFSTGHTGGIRARASHLRHNPDFCAWNGRLVLGGDDTSIMQNPLAGQSQSNLWFGTVDELRNWGPTGGWGGVWLGDAIKANEPSDPFHFAGYGARTLHLSHDAEAAVTFTVEIDAKGDGQWKVLEKLRVPGKNKEEVASVPGTVPSSGYLARIYGDNATGEWIRLTADRACRASAYFHLAAGDRPDSEGAEKIFDVLASSKSPTASQGGLIRPAARNRNLQFFAHTWSASGTAGKQTGYEVDEALHFSTPAQTEPAEADLVLLTPKQELLADAASAIVVNFDGKRYRLPVADRALLADGTAGKVRVTRELISERSVANIAGTFFEVPRPETPRKEVLDFRRIKPIASHHKRIEDFCTWRGLLVMSGCRPDAMPDGRYFSAGANLPGLWFGCVDDLWKLGKPIGDGGPWMETLVKAGVPSDPYLITGYDRKSLILYHTAAEPVDFAVEVNYSDRSGFDEWRSFATFNVPSGEKFHYDFPAGYGAHWLRISTNHDCTATAQCAYR